MLVPRQGAAAACRCRVAVKVLCALWSWRAAAAAGSAKSGVSWCKGWLRDIYGSRRDPDRWRLPSCRSKENECWLPPFFPECVARFPVHSGGLGVEGVFARRRTTVRSRPQPPAAVRNRSREGRMAVPMASSATAVIFGGCRRRVASFRVAWVALCDIPTCFITTAVIFGGCRRRVASFRVAWVALCDIPTCFITC